LPRNIGELPNEYRDHLSSSKNMPQMGKQLRCDIWLIRRMDSMT